VNFCFRFRVLCRRRPETDCLLSRISLESCLSLGLLHPRTNRTPLETWHEDRGWRCNLFVVVHEPLTSQGSPSHRLQVLHARSQPLHSRKRQGFQLSLFLKFQFKGIGSLLGVSQGSPPGPPPCPEFLVPVSQNLCQGALSPVT
jgi:hypothetical protein